ncbi:MAG: DNA repair protein RecO [Parachlamydiales bacterium]|nr:DNA repair protein RecO [Parachlamydiales bacterium]
MKNTLALTLKVIPYSDRSKIITALTKDFGIVSIMVNNLTFKKSNFVSFTSPFTLSEVIIKETKSDLFSLKDVNIIDQNLHLRKDFEYLRYAGKMTKAIIDLHFQFKKSNTIFVLLEKFLKNIFINPKSLYMSFLLKVLLNEGLINPKLRCNICNSLATNLSSGETICDKHIQKGSFIFSKSEYDILHLLTYTKSFSDIKQIDLSTNFEEKIYLIFKELT